MSGKENLLKMMYLSGVFIFWLIKVILKLSKDYFLEKQLLNEKQVNFISIMLNIILVAIVVLYLIQM